MDYWVLHHPTKGWFVGFDDYGEKPGWRPRWRWSIPASHYDTQRYWSAEAALKAVAEVEKHENQPITVKKFTT